MRVQRELARMASEKAKRPKIQSNGIDTGQDLSRLVSQRKLSQSVVNDVLRAVGPFHKIVQMAQ
jgi:hypothetical protein